MRGQLVHPSLKLVRRHAHRTECIMIRAKNRIDRRLVPPMVRPELVLTVGIVGEHPSGLVLGRLYTARRKECAIGHWHQTAPAKIDKRVVRQIAVVRDIGKGAQIEPPLVDARNS